MRGCIDCKLSGGMCEVCMLREELAGEVSAKVKPGTFGAIEALLRRTRTRHPDFNIDVAPAIALATESLRVIGRHEAIDFFVQMYDLLTPTADDN